MKKALLLSAVFALALSCIGCANPAAEKVSALHGDWYCKTDTSLTTLKFGEDGSTYTRSSYRNGFYMPVTGSYSADGSAGTVSCTLNSVTATYNFSIASDSSTLTLTSTDGSAAGEIYTKGTPAFPATGLSFGNNSSFAMFVGKSIALKPAVSPLYSSDTISWSSSDPTVATVSENAADQTATVTALKSGSVVISAKIGLFIANLSISVSTLGEAVIGNWYETDGGTRLEFNNDATGIMSQHLSGLVVYYDITYTATDTSTTITFADNGQTMPYSISSDMNTLTLTTPSSNGSTHDLVYARGNPAFPVESWTIDWGNSDTVQVGSYVEIKTQTIPDYTTDEISWTFSDNTLGSIAMYPGQRKARLTGRAPGTLTVTATMGGTSYSHMYTVTSN